MRPRESLRWSEPVPVPEPGTFFPAVPVQRAVQQERVLAGHFVQQAVQQSEPEESLSADSGHSGYFQGRQLPQQFSPHRESAPWRVQLQAPSRSSGPVSSSGRTSRTLPPPESSRRKGSALLTPPCFSRVPSSLREWSRNRKRSGLERLCRQLEWSCSRPSYLHSGQEWCLSSSHRRTYRASRRIRERIGTEFPSPQSAASPQSSLPWHRGL